METPGSRENRSNRLKNAAMNITVGGLAAVVASGIAGAVVRNEPLGMYYFIESDGESFTRCSALPEDDIAAATERLRRPNRVMDGAEVRQLSGNELIGIASKYNYHVYPSGPNRTGIFNAMNPEALKKETNEMGSLYGFTVNFDNNFIQDNVGAARADALQLSDQLSAIPVEVVKASGITEIHLGAELGDIEGEGIKRAGRFDNFKRIDIGPEQVHILPHELQHAIHAKRCENSPLGDRQIADYNDIPYKKRMPDEDGHIDFKKYALSGKRHAMVSTREDFASTMQFFTGSYASAEMCHSNDSPAFLKAGYGIASQNYFGEVTGAGAYGEYLLDIRDKACETYTQ